MHKKCCTVALPTVLFIILNISTLGLSAWISASLSESTININLAGRQRMLSQRISKSLLLLHRQNIKQEHHSTYLELQNSVHLFEQTLNAFWQGGETLDGNHHLIFILALTDTQARLQLTEGRQLWAIFSAPIKQVLSSENNSAHSLTAAIEMAIKYNLDLLKTMNQLTLAIEQGASRKVELLRLIQSSFLVCTLFMFLYILYHLRRSENSASQNNKALNKIFNSIDTSILIFDNAENLIFSNQKSHQLFKYPDGIPNHLQFTDLIKKYPNSATGFYKTGKTFHAKVDLHQIDLKNTLHTICSVHDITEQMHKEEKLTHLAFKDSLTGLANRILFHERLNQEILHSKRNFNTLAVLFIDLDGFKSVNDNFSHDTGDQLLQLVSKRLLQCCREDDAVARLGGDEFTIILTSVKHKKAAEKIAHQILTCLNKSFLIDDNVHISASIGISMYPKDNEEANSLIKLADNAMYLAKKSGKNQLRFATELSP